MGEKCPIGKNRSIDYNKCNTCIHCESIGTCEYPLDVDKQMKEGTRFKPNTPLWLPALQRNTDQVTLKGRHWYDKDGNEILLVSMTGGGLIRDGKKT